GVFLNENEAAVSITRLANALKLIQNAENFDRGLKYYEAAREILGDRQEIEEGMQYFIDKNPDRLALLRRYFNPN
ncbi:MAG: hypothetical protein AABY22_12565, partial [Nanoarchaeota archaeon]